MKGEDRAPQPGPHRDFNLPPIVPRDPLVVRATAPTCDQCGKPRSRRAKAFCSYACHHQWQREHPPEKPDPPTTAQLIAEMHAALDKLQALVLDGEELLS